MKQYLSTISLVLALALCLSAFGPVVPAQAQEEPAPPMEKLILVGPPGPMSIPLVYLVVNDKLSSIAAETELVIWENQNQLRAIVSGNQGDFVTMPSNNAAIFYNGELDVQLLDISVWNALFVVSPDTAVESFADIAGQKVVITFQGSVPDLMFQYVVIQQGLDPFADFDLQYAPNPQQGAQLLMAGEVDHAVLPEPLVTALVMQTKDGETPLHRVIRFEDEWASATDEKNKTAIAGTVALASVQDKPEVIDEFLRQYQMAVAWMLENPEEAGMMAEENLSELGFKAGPVAASLQNITWDFVQAGDARADIEAFLTTLAELSPEVIGGELPGDDFYYAGADLEGEAVTAMPTDLGPWNGMWVNAYAFIDAPAMEPLYEAIAEAAEGKTAADARAFMTAMMMAEGFDAVEISGNTITYTADSAVVATCDYALEGQETVPFGEYEVVWYTIELVSGDDACSQYVIMVPTHQDDPEAGTMLHFHFRFGDISFDDLMHNPGYMMWWPTLAESDVTAERMADEMIAAADEMAAMLSMMP